MVLLLKLPSPWGLICCIYHHKLPVASDWITLLFGVFYINSQKRMLFSELIDSCNFPVCLPGWQWPRVGRVQIWIWIFAFRPTSRGTLAEVHNLWASVFSSVKWGLHFLFKLGQLSETLWLSNPFYKARTIQMLLCLGGSHCFLTWPFKSDLALVVMNKLH